MNSVHLHIAKIALQPIPLLRPRCAGAVKQHLHAFARSATTFTSRSPDSQRVCGRDWLPLFHPSITLLNVKAGRTQGERLGGIGATQRLAEYPLQLRIVHSSPLRLEQHRFRPQQSLVFLQCCARCTGEDGAKLTAEPSENDAEEQPFAVQARARCTIG